MRTARIKVQAEEGEAMYHCMTRTVNGERLFDDQAKEVLRKQLWQIADFCGVQVVTYAIMSNHFHVLLKVPQREAVSDDELLRRYRVLYPKPTKYQQAHHDVLVKQLKEADNLDAEAWRQRQMALMGDVSQFMKLTKQRFAVWFNRSHGRYGTLWSERFKSVLVEGNGRVLTAMSAYIDLNAVRAGLVADPKDYRFCGYAEAVVGNQAAQAGLARVTEGKNWAEVQAGYRQVLFGTGAGPREQGGGIPAEELQKVMKAKGKLPLHTVLRCRVRYFTDGAVLGSQSFVAAHLDAYRRTQGRRERTAPRPLPNLTDWGDVNSLRGLRKNVFG